MSIRPCIVIPVYNHGAAVGGVVAALRHYGLPMILVDDGSDTPTRERLTQIAQQEPLTSLLRLPRNIGKGGAVMHGIRQAAHEGFTHALQIDADGQHDLGSVPQFIVAAQADPEAVICGYAVYDASVPKARLYGRAITHFWVWIETLSFAVKDSMCGFRMYPLGATLRVIDGGRIPLRMDFDTAVIVRLVWAGAPVINLPTPVHYPADGVSHFRMFRDNLRISGTHTRLVAGMLRRAPWLLVRRLFRSRRSAAHWSKIVERGSYLGILFVVYTYRFLGRAVTRVLLWPIALYFFLTAGTARRASMEYLRRVYTYGGPGGGLSRRPDWRDGLRHVLAFAESTLDKVAAWLGRIDHSQVQFTHRSELEALMKSQRGAVLIGAHLGNWEMMRALAAFGGYRTINAVVYTDHSLRFTRLLQRLNERFSLNLIQISSLGPDTAIMLKDKIDRGELLVIAGDRTPPAENGRIVRVPFLGHDAPFAQGPFVLASILECPVHLFFCLRERQGYCMYFESFAEQVILPRHRRADALREYVQRYAQRLETYCQRAPFQWFNFYDFWNDNRPQTPLASETSSRSELDHAGTKHV